MAENDLIARLERIEQLEALKKLIHTYHWNADHFDWVAWPECFTEDAIFDLPGVPGGPVSCLLLFHRGRRSGKSRNSVLQYYERDGEIAVVGSKGGLPAHPIWYLNLVAEPRCEVWIGSHRSSARARVASGEERDRWWRHITEEQPVQLEYQARTSRQIPVVLLELDFPAPGADETKGGN